MNTPTRKELYDFIDGLLPEARRKEIETLVVHNPAMRKEIAFLRRLQTVLQSDELSEKTSRKFLRTTMDAVVSVKKESWMFVLLKNSSNIFAMAMVLALIGITYQTFSVEPLQSSPGFYRDVLTSAESMYSSAVNVFSVRTKEYLQPLNYASEQGTIKIMVIGIAVLLGLGFFDEVIGKRIFK